MNNYQITVMEPRTITVQALNVDQAKRIAINGMENRRKALATIDGQPGIDLTLISIEKVK